jgi:5-methylcytosine-specific restriction enzyme A
VETLREIISALHEKLQSTSLADFYGKRKRLKGGKEWGSPLFRVVSEGTFPRTGWAFHLGGRQELQFNIGFESDGEFFRYGVAFSLKPNIDLPDPVATLSPAIAIFNSVADEFQQLASLKMWSENAGDDFYNPLNGIPNSWIQKGNFIFIGERVRVPQEGISTDTIDRAAEVLVALFPLYMRIEELRITHKLSEVPSVSLSASISRLLAEYLSATREAFTDHPLASFIRRDMRDAIKEKAGSDGDGLIFKGSAGQGDWVRGPWLGIFNPIVTSGAQQGYYPCYLFREDMRGVYLSLNQGMTEAKDHYKADAKIALRARAQNYLAMLGDQASRFPVREIDLAPASPGNNTTYYEAGNICAVYYPANSVPDEAKLVDDLKAMLGLYEVLIQGETDTDVSLDNEDDTPSNLQYEDATRFRMHKRIERNAGLVKMVKKKKGCTCEVCGTNFEARYGLIGVGYIEAHHLIPLASLKGTKVAMNPKQDFAVLCANCHRMVHRSGLVDNISRFKKEHFND